MRGASCAKYDLGQLNIRKGQVCSVRNQFGQLVWATAKARAAIIPTSHSFLFPIVSFSLSSALALT